MTSMIDFYFEFASPYGYLASLRIDEIAARHGRKVAWHPIMLGAVFKLTGSQPLMHVPLKGPYVSHDLPRFARYLGLPFKAPPVMPVNSLAASRAVVWADQDDADLARDLARTIYCAHWGEGRDIGQPEQVADIAEHVGIARHDLLEAVADPAVKQRLKDQTQAAIDRGVFGSPFIFIGEEAFWGADRLDQVEAWLARGGW
jgi:2-hydroxychromene-2-carboxylate isomerase